MKESTAKVMRWSLLRLLILGAIAETIWTVYVGAELPRRYVANHWDIAWVGLDVVQVIMLGAAAWAAWRRSTLLVIFSTSSATLLLLDAWFDVTTARHGDVFQSILLACIVEVPSALVLVWVAHRVLSHTTLLPSGNTNELKKPTTFEVQDSGEMI
jgi:hypothetical protein